MTRLGIIGAGIMGERLMRAAVSQDAAQVTGVWDPSPAAMQRIAAELPSMPHCDSAAAVIEGADCVYVASPPATHLAHARAIAAAGKALFCEKPLSVDLAEAGAFMAASGAMRAAVNFPFASSAAVAQLRGWVAEGAIGTPQHLAITVGFAAWPRQWQHDAAAWLDGPAQGGFTREVVSHFLFLALRMLGPIQLDSASASFPEPGRSEQAIRATLTAGGLPATLAGDVGKTDREDTNSFTLTGNAGSIRLRDWATAEQLDPAGQWLPGPDAIDHQRARPLVLRRQLEAVARMTRGETHGLATLQDAYDVQRVVEAILAG
jgi:predicted dehydrogenase